MTARTRAEPLRAAFLERATKAIESWSRTLPARALATAVAEPRDAMVVLSAMQQPAAWGEVLDLDPLAAARARGVAAQRRLLEAEGGVAGAEEVAASLHLTRQAVDKRRRLGKLLAVSRGGNRWAFPVWQIEAGRTLPGLEETLRALRGHDAWSRAAFFLAPSARFGGRRPIDALRGGDVEAVVRAAKGFGEHGAE